MNKYTKQLIVMLYKVFVYVTLFAVFFFGMSLRNIALQNISRTLATITLMYVLVFALMLSVYGNFKIGERKSKPIIYGAVVSVLVSDLAAYVQLMIMNTNLHNNPRLTFEHLDLLLMIVCVQSVLIIIFAYFGNYFYFKLYSPKHTLIIHDGVRSLKSITNYFERYKLQYRDPIILHCDDKEAVATTLSESEFVLLSVRDLTLRNSYIETCYECGISYAYIPAIADLVAFGGENIVFGDIPVIQVSNDGLTLGQRTWKRLLDLFVGFFGILLLIPVYVVVAIMIKLEDGGSVFFKQARYTVDGSVFSVYKFRTMKENVENYSSTSEDDRITKVGKFLRKVRLDELPQFINVMKGEMSVVGPRPEMLENVERYESELPEFRYRLQVKAGLTGIAQIEGRYNTSPEDKLKMDLLYIETFSIWMDIKLILQTLTVVFKKDSTEGFEKKK